MTVEVVLFPPHRYTQKAHICVHMHTHEYAQTDKNIIRNVTNEMLGNRKSCTPVLTVLSYYGLRCSRSFRLPLTSENRSNHCEKWMLKIVRETIETKKSYTYILY